MMPMRNSAARRLLKLLLLSDGSHRRSGSKEKEPRRRAAAANCNNESSSSSVAASVAERSVPHCAACTAGRRQAMKGEGESGIFQPGASGSCPDDPAGSQPRRRPALGTDPTGRLLASSDDTLPPTRLGEDAPAAPAAAVRWGMAKSNKPRVKKTTNTLQKATAPECIGFRQSGRDLSDSSSQDVDSSSSSLSSATSASASPPPRNELSFTEKYEKCELIGKGSTGLVYAVKLRGDTAAARRFVCKEMRMGEDGSMGCTMSEALNELGILTTLRHPNLTHVHEYFIEDGVCKIVMPRYFGGELASAVAERGSLAEEDAREVTRGILRGLRHMHAHGIAHRDLKLQNILLYDEYTTTDVRIIDFGLAKKLGGEDDLTEHTICGSPLYIAPEVITPTAQDDISGECRASYGVGADVWSCGVILYMVLAGHPPFDTRQSIYRMFAQIRHGCYSLTADPAWELVSDEAKDLVRRLLTVDPSHRISVEDALNHKWLTES